MADEEAKPEEASGGGGSKLMLVLIILIVLLLGAVGAIGYLMVSKGMLDEPTEDGAEKIEKVEEKASAEDSGEYFSTKIENLVLNITNAKGREKLMKLSFELKSVEPTIELIIGNNNAEIVDSVIGQISKRTSEELLTAGGKALLKEEMLSEINEIVNQATASNEDIKQNNILKLFFTTFVIK